MRNIELGRKQKLTTYRKIAIASWRHPRDPSTYSSMELLTEPAEDYLRSVDSEDALTLTHYVTRIIGCCLKKYPELNHFLRYGALYERKTSDIFITALLRTGEGKDLSGVILRDVTSKPLPELASELRVKYDMLRKQEDPEAESVKRFVAPLPTWVLRPLLLMQEFLTFTCNRTLSLFNFPRDQFGSAIITNVGALGIENGLIPLSPYSRCPLIISIGKVRKAAVVIGDEVKAASCVTLGFTFDHRYADGAHGALIMRRFKKIFENPMSHPEVFGETGA